MQPKVIVKNDLLEESENVGTEELTKSQKQYEGQNNFLEESENVGTEDATKRRSGDPAQNNNLPEESVKAKNAKSDQSQIEAQGFFTIQNREKNNNLSEEPPKSQHKVEETELQDFLISQNVQSAETQDEDDEDMDDLSDRNEQAYSLIPPKTFDETLLPVFVKRNRNPIFDLTLPLDEEDEQHNLSDSEKSSLKISFVFASKFWPTFLGKI